MSKLLRISLLRPIISPKNNFSARCFSSQSSGGKDRNNPEKATKSSSDVYQAEEYYQYDPYSFYDIQNKMDKYRLEQPKPSTQN